MASRSRAPFQPRFTLALLYLGGFFFAFALLMVIPALVTAFGRLPPGPAQEDMELATEIARQVIAPRLWIAFAAAVAATAAATYAGFLPGLRRS